MSATRSPSVVGAGSGSGAGAVVGAIVATTVGAGVGGGATGATVAGCAVTRGDEAAGATGTVAAGD
ncbi:MAG: hypothetical protein M3487_04580, partial [Actinomycetota bacterium]|nr:hypothetical protein [Actinomycetota bacterium]